MGLGMAAYFGFILYLLVNGLRSRFDEWQQPVPTIVGGGPYQALPDSLEDSDSCQGQGCQQQPH